VHQVARIGFLWRRSLKAPAAQSGLPSLC